MSEVTYREQVRNELLALRTDGQIGFRDEFGFIVDYNNGEPDTRGEGTLHTAIAAIAVAAGSYHRDNWEENNANNRLDELLRALTEKGWGNQDGLGRLHPIRHPDVREYDSSNNFLRLSPLTKDGFGAVICACLYSYKSPHSSEAVKQRATTLIQKWTEYLVLSQWRTHSQYIAGEFETHPDNGEKYKNIFSEGGGLVSHKGPEAFLLLPHEIYAIQSVAAALGQQTSNWDVWSGGMAPALKQTLTDIVAPYIGAACGRAISSILDHLVWSVPYSIPIGGPGWEFGKIEGIFSFGIPDDIRLGIEDAFSTAVTDIIREWVRIDSLINRQGDQLIGLAIGRILDLLPAALGADKWRSILTLGLRQICPWLDGTIWVEAMTLAGTLQLLKTQKTFVQSYSVWSYIAIFETRPELADLLRPLVQEFFSALRGQGNPIGLWAWLAEDSGRVNEHLATFFNESPYRWSSFAYGSTAYNDWVTDVVSDPLPGAKQSPRLDYLVLQGLNEKGYPRGLSDIPNDWLEEFKTAIRDVFKDFLANAEKLLKELGIVALKGLSKIDVHADTPLIPPVQLHGDAGHGDAHGDMGHADVHGDAGHGDAHGDAGHGDAHGDAGHGDAHGDAGHGDAHGDTGAHIDTHGDFHGDVGGLGGPHGDAHGDSGGLGVHLDFAVGGAHADSGALGIHGDANPISLHGDSNALGVHADTPSIGLHGDSPQVGIHADTPQVGHLDVHGDVVNHGHMDTALIPPVDFDSNSPHGDAHGDAGHGDGHGDAGHGDVHGDAGHGDVHGDAGHGDAHSDIGHGDAHGDVGHFGGGPHADWGSVGIHGDSSSVGIHGDSPAVGIHGDSPAVETHADSPNTGIHGDVPEKQIHGDTPKIGHGDVHVDTNN